MNCPRETCDYTGMRPQRTSLDGGSWRREYKCPQCRHEFETREVEVAELDTLHYRAGLWSAICDERTTTAAHTIQQLRADRNAAQAAVRRLQAENDSLKATLAALSAGVTL